MTQKQLTNSSIAELRAAELFEFIAEHIPAAYNQIENAYTFSVQQDFAGLKYSLMKLRAYAKLIYASYNDLEQLAEAAHK